MYSLYGTHIPIWNVFLLKSSHINYSNALKHNMQYRGIARPRHLPRHQLIYVALPSANKVLCKNSYIKSMPQCLESIWNYLCRLRGGGDKIVSLGYWCTWKVNCDSHDIIISISLDYMIGMAWWRHRRSLEELYAVTGVIKPHACVQRYATCLLILMICILQQEFEELTFETAVKSAKIAEYIAHYVQ